MPPKKENSKAAAARERKEEAATVKKGKEAAAKEKAEAADWAKGSKDNSKKEDEERKRQEKLEKAREKAALEAAENKANDSIRRVKTPGSDKGSSASPAFASSAARGSAKVATERALSNDNFSSSAAVESFAARGIDDAITLMDSLDVSESKISSSAPERHPERRVKAAYAAYEESELPRLKEENPGLRHTQLKEMLWKQWQKAPENPMNQAHVSYDTTADEAREMVKAQKTEKLEAFKVNY